MSFHENPFSVLHFAEGDDGVPVVISYVDKSEKNPGVEGEQKQRVFTDQSPLIRFGGRPGNGEMDRGSENGIGFHRFHNGASNGQSKGSKVIGQHDINEQYGRNQYGYENGQRNGYANLDEQSPPTDGDHSSEGGWSFVGEKRGGPQRKRRGSWRNNNSSRFRGLNDAVKSEKFSPKPKDIGDKSVRVGVVEGEDTTEQITRRNQSEERTKKVQRNMTLKEYEELILKRNTSKILSPAEELSTPEKTKKPEQCSNKALSMDFFVKLSKRKGDRNRVGYRRDIESVGGGGGGQCDELAKKECSENAPFNINIQDPEQFPCLNLVINT